MSRRTEVWLVNIGLVVFALLMLVPFYWMLSSSFKPRAEILTVPISVVPRTLTLENYAKLFAETLFARSLLNSTLVCAANIILQVGVSALAGFAFAQYRFNGQGVLFLTVLAGAMIPVTAQLVPNYVIMSRLGWIDTWLPLIIPAAANPLGVLWMRQTMSSLPSEVLDAARLDGAGEFGLFWRLALPMSRPALVALSLFVFTVTWNEFLLPLVYLRTRELYTVQLMISSFFRTGFQQNFDLLMTASVLSLLPMLVLFLGLRRHFLAGVRIGANLDRADEDRKVQRGEPDEA